MKLSHRLLILTLILALSVASMAAAPAAGKNKFPYAGFWKGTAADGGKNELKITYRNEVYNVQFTDAVSASCGGGVAVGKGYGKVVGTTLVTGFVLKCKNSGAVVSNSYNVGMTIGANPLAAADSAGTAYTMRRGVGCNGR